jgi:hypothetical protein
MSQIGEFRNNKVAYIAEGLRRAKERKKVRKTKRQDKKAMYRKLADGSCPCCGRGGYDDY